MKDLIQDDSKRILRSKVLAFRHCAIVKCRGKEKI